MIPIETLRRYRLFAGQDYQMLKQLSKLGHEEVIEADEWLFHQGNPARKFYLVLDGAVSLSEHRYEEKEHMQRVGTYSTGEVVGWGSMFEPHTYTLCAKAVQETRLLVIDAGRLRDLLGENPAGGYHFMANLAKVLGDQMRSLTTQFISMTV